MQSHPPHTMDADEVHRLAELRQARRHRRKGKRIEELGLGDRVADAVARVVGSWRFIIIQSVILVIWMALNVTAYIEHWDPYPDRKSVV